MSTLDFLTEIHHPKCPTNKKCTVFLRYLPSSNSPFSFRQLSAILPAIHRPEQLPFYSTLWHFYYGWRGNFASPSVTMCYTALWWQLITDGELLEGSRIAGRKQNCFEGYMTQRALKDFLKCARTKRGLRPPGIQCTGPGRQASTVRHNFLERCLLPSWFLPPWSPLPSAVFLPSCCPLPS